MSELAERATEQWRGRLLLALAWSAGFVDAASYLGLGGVFTANMTGNTVLLGLAIARLDLAGSLRSAMALTGFCIGVIGGALLLARDRTKAPWPSAVTITLALEGLVLIALGLAWSAAGNVPNAEMVGAFLLIAGCSMGLQSAALKRIGIPTVGSTAITGTVTGVMAGAVGWLHTPFASAQRPQDASATRKAFALPATVWSVYALGALTGGFSEGHWHGVAIGGPAAAVGAVALIAKFKSE